MAQSVFEYCNKESWWRSQSLLTTRTSQTQQVIYFQRVYTSRGMFTILPRAPQLLPPCHRFPGLETVAPLLRALGRAANKAIRCKNGICFFPFFSYHFITQSLQVLSDRARRCARHHHIGREKTGEDIDH